MSKQSNSYTFTFALIICVVCSLSLSAVSEGLRPRKELNAALDVKKNILKAVKLDQPITKESTPDQILKVYNEKIQSVVVNGSGEIVEGREPESIKEGEDLYPLYTYKEGSTLKSYAFPIIGKGLWSTLYGYLAIEPDAMTVRGITFYKHGETPGLGAEIEKDWFQDNFVGKKIWDLDGNVLRPIQVMKGKVADFKSGNEANFYVDGISGATMTANGVTDMLDKWIKAYEPFLASVRK